MFFSEKSQITSLKKIWICKCFSFKCLLAGHKTFTTSLKNPFLVYSICNGGFKFPHQTYVSCILDHNWLQKGCDTKVVTNSCWYIHVLNWGLSQPLFFNWLPPMENKKELFYCKWGLEWERHLQDQLFIHHSSTLEPAWTRTTSLSLPLLYKWV